VGKSSLINAMAKEKIAITSKTPGRTQLANFFQFRNFRLIDLPGYGFSQTSKQKTTDIAFVIDNYLSQRSNLYGVFQICDVSVITELDKKMSDYFEKKFVNHFIILNKIDKLGENKTKSELGKISKYLNINKDKFFLVSAKDNIGIKTVFAKIDDLLKKVHAK
jgi:GTP-binding protein